MEWKYTDPRLDINKYANIIICRPSLQGNDHLEAGTAHVEVKHTYSIVSSFEDQKYSEDWSQDWCWIYAPENK